MFASEEQPALSRLPQVAYEISRWVYGRRVAKNGHVVWERNFYSVPFAHVGTSVDLRVTDRVLQAYRGTAPTTPTYRPVRSTVSGTPTGSGTGPSGSVHQR